MRRINLALITLGILFHSTQKGHAVDFVHEVMPILKQYCAECHAGEAKKGGLSINTRAELLSGSSDGKVIELGQPDKSLFLELITSTDDDEWMPPKGPRVPAEKVEILRKWIATGAKWEPGITLGKGSWEPPLLPRTVKLPPATKGRDHPIDRILDADLSKRKQTLPDASSNEGFLRRASLDIVGLLPSPEEFQKFTSNKSANKREELIETLLSNDIAYADHWLTTWNDLLRNDYTGTGFITGGRKQITTWLYASLRDNKPYDQMVRELISPSADSAGFINGIKWRGEVNASQTLDIQFAQNISQVFLGINMKCASCHDSFIDRWTLKEAYGLAAIYAAKPLEIYRCDKATGKFAEAKWIFPELGEIDPKKPKNERLKDLAKLMTHPKNGRFTRTVVNRIWHRLMGRGIVHPVDAMHTEPWNEDLLDYLAVRFAEDGYDLKKMIRFIMTSQAYQAKSVILKADPGDDYQYAGPIAKRMTAEQLMDSVWQITETNPGRAEAKVNRDIPVKEPEPKAPTPPKELKHGKVIAKWIWHPESATLRKTNFKKTVALKNKPLKAIMMATCDNAFVMRINNKQVAQSKDWQKPLYVDLTASFKAGENQIEVDGEMFGGSAGFICQITILDGNETKVVATDKTWEASKPGGKWEPAKEVYEYSKGPWGAILKPNSKPGTTPSGNTPPVRAALVKNDFLMRSLGRPHRDQVVTTRPSELTTLQAIDLANGDILEKYLNAGARKLVSKGKSSSELIKWLYQYAFSRNPSENELTVLTEVAADGKNPVAVEDLLWIVIMQPEFQIVR